MRRALAALLLAALVLVTVGACSTDSNSQGGDPGSPPTGQQSGGQGPFFPECGGISDETIGQLTQVPGLVNTARNSVGCQWLVQGYTFGPHFSFNWYRGSPISEERGNEELTRTSVEDINIGGKNGWIAVGTVPGVGDNLCEIGIQFNDDFIEWSVSFGQPPFPNPCDVAKELTRQSIAASK